ncbi:prealbumin-like fold domain-containing protein [Agromyces sp. CCNWLW203]|uniref:prealbumin-like fold domain-containing protein n=1 Tax=Agromyces sp. CCNWLW203 TaxID=3112842 RepID=UPI002F963C3A
MSFVVASALVASGGAVAMAVAPAQGAAAATLSNGIQTSFEIDGNTAGANDWVGVVGSTPKPPYLTASGHQSGGIVAAQKSWDEGTTVGNPGTCGANLGTDDIITPSTSLDDATWPEQVGTANDKGDACTGGSAYEVVTVNGVQHTIFYAYWTRYSGSGDMSSYEVFQGPAAGRADDYLIEFNYNAGGGGSTSVQVLGWTGSGWSPVGGTVVYQAAVGTNTDTNTTGNAATFGEMAVDLTASGLLPTDGSCRSFLDAGFVTKTGEGGPATLKDILKSDSPITLSNCGGLVVEKVGTDGAPDANFNYAVTRSGGGVVHDGTLTGPADTVAGNNGLGAVIGIGDTHSWSNVFAGNDYQIVESAPPAPWALQGYSCAVTNPATNQQEVTTNGSFKLYVGATTTCTITNVTSGVQITKVAQGDAADFDFTVNGAPVVVAGNTSSQVFWYTPGSVVNIVEQVEAGNPQWNLTGVGCTPPGNAQTDVATATASVLTVAGLVVDCTYTNVQDGQIRIIKNVAGSNGIFEFTTTGADLSGFELTTVGGTATKLFDSVAPGVYTVTETTPVPFYDLTGLSCVEDVTGDSVVALVDGKVTITVQPGELVTCTYTNTQRGNIIVMKQTNPDESAESFDFTLTGQSGFALTDDQAKSFLNIVPGQYTLAELAKAGWDVTSMTCSDEDPTTDSPIAITLSPGETVDCTVLNTATKGGVTVEKTVEGVPEGYDWSFDISIDPAPMGQVGTIAVTDEDPTAEWTDLDVGTQYTLTETGLPGWVEGAITCTGIDDESDAAGFQFTVTPGLVLSCEITNTPEPAEVEVEKHVSGLADGTAWSFDFTLAPVPDGETGTKAATHLDPTVDWSDLEIGTVYTLTESVPDGWVGGAITCEGLADLDGQTPGFQFEAMPGQSLVCDVTNRVEPGDAEITKTSVGGDGSFTFVLTPLAPAGPPVQQVINTVGGTGTTSFTGLVPGTEYSLAEVDPGDGWIAGSLACTVEHADETSGPLDETGFIVEADDSITCAITNTAKSTIVIVKNIDGADDTFDFTGTWLDPPAFEIETTDGTGQVAYTDVEAGSYTVEELLTNAHVGELSCTDSMPNGTASTVDGLVGSIELDPGETVTCTYSNTQLGKIIVDKNVTFDSDQSFDFEYSDGDDTTPFALTGDATPWESGLIEPGTYTVEELGELNWDLANLSCVGSEGVSYEGGLATIELLAGEVVTCTYLNAPDTGDVTVRKIVEDVPQGYAFDFEISISPMVAGQDATQHVTQADASVTWTGLVVGETYTLTEGDEEGWNEGDIVCIGLADADVEADGFQFDVTPGLSLSCTVTNTAVPGEVEVTKIVEGPIGDAPWSFDVTIAPVPDGQDATQAVTNVDPTVGWSDLEVGTIYTLTETLPAEWTGEVFVCAGLEDLSGDAGYQFVATPGLQLDCAVTNVIAPPTGLIEKNVSSIAQRIDGTWDITYTVSVENQSDVLPLVYDLTDVPQFGVGIVINEGHATGPVGSLADDWDPVAGIYDLAEGLSLGAGLEDVYTIAINATVPEVVFDTSQDLCSPDDALDAGGFRNTAFLIVGEGDPQPATDCEEPGRALITKTFDGAVRDGVTGNWTVDYTVTVTNVGPQPLFYDLSDDLGFPAGVEIVSATASSADVATDLSAWNGDTVTELVDDEQLLVGGVHAFDIEVVADVDEITDIDDVTCLASTSGRGFFNEAELLNGTVVTPADDCGTIPVGQLTLAKNVDLSAFEGIDLADLDLGLTPEQLATLQHLAAKDWTLSAAGPVNLGLLGHAGTVFTVPTGDYGLAEAPTAEASAHPLLAYFRSVGLDGWGCIVGDDERELTELASVELGELTSCELTNRAVLVDVGIEKNYDLSGLPDDAIEGGDEFDYVLTVTNNSSVPVEDLDVTDIVDPELEVTGPAIFSGAGTWTEQPTIGDNAFAAHGDGPFAPGSVTTITIPVMLPLPEPVEADIVDPDDPIPPLPEIDIEDVPNTACVAITSGEGVLGDLIEANNCDEVEVPRKAIDPAAYVRCIADVPWLYFNVAASEHVETGDITVTWTSADPDGDGPLEPLTKVETVPWDDRDGRLLWPGAAVDENGVPYEFPGWRPITEEDLTNPPVPGTRFGDLILDENVPTYPWRDMVNPATITFSVNPSQSVLAVYPQALPACAIEREPSVDIVKTASVQQAKPGTNFDYTFAVSTTGTGSADPVEVFDEIPSHLRVDDITTAPSPAFPRWENCEVTGTDSGGYGGTLHCELLGVLGPNYPTAPPIVLDVHVNANTKASSIVNTGEVCWQNADDTSPEPAVLCDDSTVTVQIPQPMAVTGFAGGSYLWIGALLLLLGGAFVGGTYVIRRRRTGVSE